jgi:putative phage-type endonuclease
VRPIRIPTVPGSPEWRALRRTGIGASDIAVITGDSRWGSISSLYQDKLGYAADPLVNPSMEAGQWLEDLIARWYAEKTGHRIRRINALLRSRAQDWMIATPDREVRGGRAGLLEVKVTDQPGERWGEPGSDQVPDDVREQVTWQAAVADVEVVDIAVFFTRSRRRELYTVGRDPALVSELIDYGAAFWRSVQTRTPPEPVNRPVRHLLREDEIEADAELTALVESSLALRAELAAVESDQKQVDDQIRALLDQVGGARGPGFRIHYRPNADAHPVAWEKVAVAYRDLLIEAGWPLDEIARVERELTETKRGARPLLIKPNKETSVVAA